MSCCTFTTVQCLVAFAAWLLFDLQERCGVEQKHIGPYLGGQGGPPLMQGTDSQGVFLKETQQWITEEEQVRPSAALVIPQAFCLPLVSAAVRG